MNNCYYIRIVMYPSICGFGEFGDLIELRECDYSEAPHFNSSGTWGNERNGIHHVWFNMRDFTFDEKYPNVMVRNLTPEEKHLKKYLNRIKKLNYLCSQ